jgi:hypothetical protein
MFLFSLNLYMKLQLGIDLELVAMVCLGNVVLRDDDKMMVLGTQMDMDLVLRQSVQIRIHLESLQFEVHLNHLVRNQL